MYMKWKRIKNLNTIVTLGQHILVSKEGTDDHVDYVKRENGKWYYAYTGSEVQDMTKYTHYFLPLPVGSRLINF